MEHLYLFLSLFHLSLFHLSLFHLSLLLSRSPSQTTMAMLPRAARPAMAALNSAVRAGFHSSAAQAAPLREIEQRVKSVRNIEKITKVGFTRTPTVNMHCNAAFDTYTHTLSLSHQSESRLLTPTELVAFSTCAATLIRPTVDEDDCFHQAQQGSACHGCCQGLRSGQQR